MNKYEYQVEARYGYHAIDLYIDGKKQRTVITNISRKVAELLVGELNQAIQYGFDKGARDMLNVASYDDSDI